MTPSDAQQYISETKELAGAILEALNDDFGDEPATGMASALAMVLGSLLGDVFARLPEDTAREGASHISQIVYSQIMHQRGVSLSSAGETVN